MAIFKTVTIAAALIAGATSLALAQNGPATGGEPPVAGGAGGSAMSHSSMSKGSMSKGSMSKGTMSKSMGHKTMKKKKMMKSKSE
ncbi:MAG: hypothetical protein WBD53_03460 [Xanthobacteraceae bacterium]